MVTKYVLILACAYVLGISQVCAKADWIKNLSDDQIKQIFRTDRENVPEFSGINIQHLKSHRTGRKMIPIQFTIEGKHYNLNLHTAYRDVYDRRMPVWTVETNRSALRTHGVSYTYHEVDEKTKDLGVIFYEDSEHYVTLRRSIRGASYKYDGVIILGYFVYMVQSLPESLWREMTSEDIFYDHIVYRVNSTLGDSGMVIVNKTEEQLDVSLTALYPKLVIAVDYELFSYLEEDISATLKFVATYWNAVNLIYQDFKSPRVELTITGIVIAKDEHAMNYITQSQNVENPKTAEMSNILRNANSYFGAQFQVDTDFRDFHQVMLMTGLLTGKTRGIAYIGTICNPVYNVAVVADRGALSSIMTAAHELGHALSLPHDSSKSGDPCFGYPGDTITVMSKSINQSKKHKWSTCNYDQLKYFATLKSAECLRNSS